MLCRRAEIRPIRVHDPRHPRASLMLAEGVAVRTIMETLGHGTITMDTYPHVMETTLREAAARMDDALRDDDKRSEEGDDPPRQGCLRAAERRVVVSRSCQRAGG